MTVLHASWSEKTWCLRSLMFGIARIRARHKLSINLSTKRQMQCGLNASPPVQRWMKDSLDRDAFHTSLQVLGVRVPANKTTGILKSEHLKKCVAFVQTHIHWCIPFSRFIIDLPRIKSVVGDPSGGQNRKVVLLKVGEEGASRNSVHKPLLNCSPVS